MKSCPNCRVIHPDEYAGQCQECGAPLGGVAANASAGGGNLAFSWARQIQEGARETSQENAMKRGNYDGVKLAPGLVDVARDFVTVDHELIAKLEAKHNAA